jgi:hypothetical protein
MFNARCKVSFSVHLTVALFYGGGTLLSPVSVVHVCKYFTNFNCCFTVHFDKYKNILPTNALFIKNIKRYNVYLTPTCFGPSWTINREYTFVPR